MRRARLRSVGGWVLLTLVTALTVAGTLPRLALSGTLPACITESSGTAWLGVHLSLLSPSAACPEGSFAPGAHYAEIARFSIVLSVSALVAILAMLVGALGLGLGLRTALRGARVWLRRRLELPAVPASVVAHRRPPLTAVVAAFRAALWVDSRQLRGPPVAAALA